MHNSYFSSVHCSFSSSRSLPFAAFNDYSHWLLNQRCDRTLLTSPSSLSSCCCCCHCCCSSTCSVSTGVMPVNPSLLYGLRQSNLLQWSASKRLVLGSGDRVYYRVLGRDRCLYEFGKGRKFGGTIKCMVFDEDEDSERGFNVSDRFVFGCKDRGFNGRNARRIRGGNVRCMVSEEEGNRFGFGGENRSFNGRIGRRVRGGAVKCSTSEEESDEFGVGDVDEVISLLSEEVGEECFVSKEGNRKRNVSRKMEGRKGGKSAGDSFRRNSRIGGSGSVKNDHKSGYEVVVDDTREERSREEGTGNVSRKMEVRKGEKSGGNSFRRNSRISGLGLVKNDRNSGYEVVMDDTREERSREEENKTDVLRNKNQMERKKSSSCSSYYSLPSTGDFEQDTEVEENYRRTMDESTKKQEVPERARHQVSTSGIRRDEEISRKQVVREREHHLQRSSTRQDSSQSQYKDSNFRPGAPARITTLAESLKQEPHNGNSGHGSSASQLHVDGANFLHKEQYGTERSEDRETHTSGSVLIDKSSTQYVQKEGEYKQKRSSQYDFESHSSDKNSRNETMSGTVSEKTSISRSGFSTFNSQSEGVTALHQERFRDKKDEAFRKPVNRVNEDTAQGLAGHLEKTSMQFVGEFIEKEEQNRLHKSTQYDLEHTSKHGELTQSELMSKSSMKEAPTRASGSGSSVLNYRGGARPLFQGLHMREEQDQGEDFGHIRHEDTMDSARNMEHSSTQFVGEFMEKARMEISTSELQKDKQIFHSELAREREEDQEVRQLDGSQGDQNKDLDSRHKSGGSGTKGPSDEMWDVAESPVQEASLEEQEAITSDSAVVKRSGKSFWNIVADVARFRWGSRAETPKSAGTSNGKSPSYDSGSGETWFTGREHERSDEDTKGGRRGLPQTTGSQLKQEGMSSPSSAVIKARDKARYREVQAPSSSSPLETGSTKYVSYTSPEDNPDSDKNGKSSRTNLSGTVVIETLLPLSVGENKVSPLVGETAETVRTQAPGICSMERIKTGRSKASSSSSSQMRETGTSESSKSGSIEKIKTGRSDPARTGSINIIEPGRSEPSGTGLTKIKETARNEPSGSGLTQQPEQLGSTELIEVSNSRERDMELKRRKLQRNNQVLRDRYDEWEEACQLDIEQRRMDEMFMREALLEAQKAADSWEVPVGAVLVQHGKIIARGCNLVEELRDSTAHAEMICIREGSNKLQSWRLAETTLYVTLEPCPMCAGAILQARIDTLVWGAPNKLLGADGSWIRLFPDTEGGNGSEGTRKPAAPVHPFHPKITIRRGVLASECAGVMQQFFQLRRRKKEKKAEPSIPQTRLPVSHHPSKFLAKMHQIFHIFC